MGWTLKRGGAFVYQDIRMSEVGLGRVGVAVGVGWGGGGCCRVNMVPYSFLCSLPSNKYKQTGESV